jgi:hypothetical protein
MIVYGGYYREKCIFPHWDEYYGSAGRAAAILKNFNIEIKLKTFVSENNLKYLKYFSSVFDINLEETISPFDIEFEYLHSLSNPKITSNKSFNDNKNESTFIESKNVLCYGTMESNAPLIIAEKAVFDVQSSKLEDVYHHKNKISSIVFLLNYEESVYLSKATDLKQIKEFFFNKYNNLEILVIKDGPFGGIVFSKEDDLEIPIFKNNKIFKIGTGDIFSAVFSYLWMFKYRELGLKEIINISSFSTAYLSKNRNSYECDILSEYKNNTLEKVFINKNKLKRKVYLAGPFFTVSERWQVENIKQYLEKFGFDVFSPVHKVGFSNDKKHIATEDLKGLDESDSVFAILNGFDPGTIFEIGYAIAKKKKVIIYVENYSGEYLTMFEGTGCIICEDITSAVYNLVWNS